MLPPPITTAISSPSAATCAISPTMRSMVARLIPNESSPIRASPLSLSRMRLYFADAAISGSFFGPVFILLRLAHLLHHFGGKIAGSLLYAFAHDIEHETRYRSALCLKHRFNALFVVLDETLPEQCYLLQVLLHSAFDHFFHDVRRLTGGGSLGSRNVALLLDRVGRHAVLRKRDGLGPRDMLCDLARELVVAARNIDENSDLGAVDVVGDPPFRFDPGKTPDRDVLADAPHQRLARFLDGGTAEGQRRERRHVRRVPLQDETGKRAREFQEILVLRDEVRFAIDLDDRRRLCIGRNVDRDDPLCRGARRRLGRLVPQTDAQQLFGLGQIP